jgi:AcrR family transcriptional regulator
MRFFLPVNAMTVIADLRFRRRYRFFIDINSAISLYWMSGKRHLDRGNRDVMNDLGKGSQYRLTAAKGPQESDGRKHRSQKSQARIVNAMLELVAQGNLEPSADQIADIAEVGRRSVFRHFKDMDTLYREVSDSIEATMGSIVQQPFEAADWRGRVLELVDRRAIGFEKMKPFLLAGQVHRHRSAFLKTSHARFVGMLRMILLGILPKDAAGNVVLVEAIDLLLSFESWNRLREDQGLSIAKAKLVLKNAIESLLQGHA